MSFDEVGNLTSNLEGAEFAVRKYIEMLYNTKLKCWNHFFPPPQLDYVAKHSSDIKVTWVSKRKEYIKATAPVFVWEKLLVISMLFLK